MTATTGTERLGGVSHPGDLLQVDGLSVTFGGKGRKPVRAVDGVSFSVRPGEVVGLVGESGGGKSVTSLAIMGLLPRRGVKVGGSVRFEGRELVGASRSELRGLRGREMAMVFQDPMTSLHPVVPVGTQVTEVLRQHTDLDRAAARQEAEDLLHQVGIPDPKRRLDEYPHQLSSPVGLRQRALIVISDRVGVMYLGVIVEEADSDELYANPLHPYTISLMSAIPVPDPDVEDRRERILLAGDLPSPANPPSGCRFHTRCPFVQPTRCHDEVPALRELAPGHRVACHWAEEIKAGRITPADTAFDPTAEAAND